MATKGSAEAEGAHDPITKPLDDEIHNDIGGAEIKEVQAGEGDTEGTNGDRVHEGSTGGNQQDAEKLAKKAEKAKKTEKAEKAEKKPLFEETEENLQEHDGLMRDLADRYREVENLRLRIEKDYLASVGVRKNTSISEETAQETNPSCYVEIRNLVLIDSSLIHKKALEEWDRKQKLFASRVERKTKKVGSLKNEVYQLIGFFSVFQGVLFTAVAQSNLLYCYNVWSPILLSLLASFVTIAGVCQKLNQISSLEVTIYSEGQSLKEVTRWDRELRREGRNFVFAKFSGDEEKGSKKGYFGLYAVGAVSFLVFFMIAFPVSHRSILCHPGPDRYRTP